MNRRCGAVLSTLLAALASAPAARATTGSVFGIGPRTRAWVGAGASQAAGYESAFQNPAALALESDVALSAGYGVESTWLYSQRGSDPERRFDAEPRGNTLLGFTLPLGVLGQRFVLGFASSSPGGSVARADLPLAEQPQFPLLLSRQQAVDFDLALGVRPVRFLALGVGLRALATLVGSAEVDQTKSATTTKVSDALEPALAPSAGVSAFFGPKATLALVLRAPLRADFDIRLKAVDLGATQLPPLNLAGVAHYDPLAVQLEYAQRLGSFEAMVGAVYQRFKSTPALLPRTVSCPPERPACQALDASSPGFHDTVDLHFAVTLSLSLSRSAEAKLRAGYAFVPSPAPEQTGAENLLDNGRHRFGLGYGIALKGPLPPLALDGAITVDELVPRTHHKSPEVAPENAGFPTLSTRGHAIGLNLGLTVKL